MVEDLSIFAPFVAQVLEQLMGWPSGLLQTPVRYWQERGQTPTAEQIHAMAWMAEQEVMP